MKENERIRALLENAFGKDAWHGPPIKEVLASITVQDATKRIGNAHSIIELVAHMGAWRNFVLKKLEGDETFEITEERNFPVASNWATILTELDTTQQKLLAAIHTFPEEKLGERVPSRNYDYYTLLHGIVHHDIYHIGQIQLIKKAL